MTLDRVLGLIISTAMTIGVIGVSVMAIGLIFHYDPAFWIGLKGAGCAIIAILNVFAIDFWRN